MKTLLSLAVLAALAAPLHAQTAGKPDTTLSVYGDTVVLLSNVPAVTSVVAFRGYLLNEDEMDAVNTIEYSDGYSIEAGGLGLDGSVHGPSLVTPWDKASGELEYILKIAKTKGKRKAAEELADRLDDAKRAVKALALEKKAVEEARKLAPGNESARTDFLDVAAMQRRVSELEMQLAAAKTEVDHAAMSRSLDLFKATLPK